MKTVLASTLVASMSLIAPQPSWAQQAQGFAMVGFRVDHNGPRHAIGSGGMTVDLFRSWMSLGAHADLFIGSGGFGGRAGVFAQGNIIQRRELRVFAAGGSAWGAAGSGPAIGGGIEIWGTRRLGFRMSVHDHLVSTSSFYCPSSATGTVCHKPSLMFGVAWR